MKNTIKLFLLLVLLCWLPSTLFAEVTYYHTDNLGTPMAMTDSTGKLVWQGDYYPFGEEYQIQATPNKNKRRFTGKEKDEESGLHYFGARYMDEISGRFVSPDPVTAVDAQTSKTNTALLGNPLRLNRYVYGLNNPHRYIDPDGNVPVFLVPALIGAAISYLSAPDVANAPKSSSSQTFQSHGGGSIAAGVVGGVGLRGVGSVLAAKRAIGVNDLIKGSKQGRVTKGRTTQFERTGGVNQMNNDFSRMGPSKIKNIPSGRTGKLQNGSSVNIRSQSKDGRPTLEVQSGKNRIKFRYNN